ncbi:MAG TPA: protein translocase subunit SecD, partial [Methylomirabilota bacterium]|nr:protein translocase subunit SecD [Methylomirabilota bacterium]
GLVLAVLYGGLALGGTWKPKLGLDLQGGTRITLEANTDTGEEVTPEKLEEAAGIIDSRVNASGVAEAEVATQGARNIIVEIPGQNRKDLVDTVKQTAQLRFRLVAGSAPGQPTPPPSGSPSPSAGATPSDKASPSGKASPSASPSEQPSEKASPRGRAVSRGLVSAGETTTPAPKGDKPAKSGNEAQPTQSPQPLPGQPTAQAPATAEGAPVGQPLQWIRNPGSEWLTKFGEYTCPKDGQQAAPVRDVPDQPLITCDENGNKFLLSASVIQGTQIKDASAGIPQNDVGYVVTLDFEKSARTTFADVSRAMAGTGEQFAIVLDGTVISAPGFDEPIPSGNAQIRGDFTQEEAQTLANSLKYGALPLKFTAPVVTEEGPSLAADQLAAGIWAGIIGLALVLVYCLIYYRGLGLVVFASLMVAAALTYAVVLIMSETAGFTLTLPGIAGLIIGVGITADSFIVYFERIRDEMRDGKSLRVAVEAGWVRARATCLAADAVSLLAAVVLYIFAIGVVRGFAFALGISTIIDIVVFFFFTKPMVTWLARLPFFSTGHKLSGLDAEALGIDHLPGVARTRTAGGSA